MAPLLRWRYALGARSCTKAATRSSEAAGCAAPSPVKSWKRCTMSGLTVRRHSTCVRAHTEHVAAPHQQRHSLAPQQLYPFSSGECFLPIHMGAFSHSSGKKQGSSDTCARAARARRKPPRPSTIMQQLVPHPRQAGRRRHASAQAPQFTRRKAVSSHPGGIAGCF